MPHKPECRKYFGLDGASCPPREGRAPCRPRGHPGSRRASGGAGTGRAHLQLVPLGPVGPYGMRGGEEKTGQSGFDKAAARSRVSDHQDPIVRRLRTEAAEWLVGSGPPAEDAVSPSPGSLVAEKRRLMHAGADRPARPRAEAPAGPGPWRVRPGRARDHPGPARSPPCERSSPSRGAPAPARPRLGGIGPARGPSHRDAL